MNLKAKLSDKFLKNKIQRDETVFNTRKHVIISKILHI